MYTFTGAELKQNLGREIYIYPGTIFSRYITLQLKYSSYF